MLQVGGMSYAVCTNMQSGAVNPPMGRVRVKFIELITLPEDEPILQEYDDVSLITVRHVATVVKADYNYKL